MFTSPEQNILHLGLKEGMHVADLGAGTGFYSKACSERVGKTGKVYAIEVQKELVKKLENELRVWGISNIDCIWGDIEVGGGTKIADNSMDAIVISNVLFQVEDKLGLLSEVCRILKKGGKVLVIDRNSQDEFSNDKKGYFISKDRVKDLFEKKGFKISEEISTTPSHYDIIFMYE